MAIAGTLSPTHALRRSRHLDSRVLVGVLLTLLAIGGAMVVFNAANDSRGVLVTTRDLPAGAILTASDLTVAHVRVDDSLYQAALPEQALDQMVGKQLAEPVHPQEMLVREQISIQPTVAPTQSLMTIPVSNASAVARHMHPNDTVTVLATFDKGKPDSKTTVVLQRARVYDVGFDQSAGAVNTSSSSDPQAGNHGQITTVTLILDNPQQQETQLAQAKWNADLDVVLLPASAVTQPNTQAGDGH